jgi:hypothetical protein
VPVIDTVQDTTTTPTLTIQRWHEKSVATLVFGGLGLIGLTVLVVAILLVSQDSTRPSGHPVVSVAPTSKPAVTLPQSTIAAPSPVVAPPSPNEAAAPPTDAPPTVIEAPAPETAAAQVPAAQPPPANWPRWRRWLWALQHPHGQ